MSGLFGGGGGRKPAPPPPPPTPDNSAEELRKVEDERTRRTRSAGRAADILTSGQGVMDEVMSAKKTLGA